jgi:GTPase SAR1 family protein
VEETAIDSAEHSPRIVVVGTCASGKSTLVAALKEHGFDAGGVAQEHSAIPDLWNHSRPDVLVYLDVDLAIVRERRSPTWSEVIFDAQRERLRQALGAADLIIDTGSVSLEESVARVREFVLTRSGEKGPSNLDGS